MRQSLPPAFGDGVERADVVEIALGEEAGIERRVLRGAAVVRDAVEIFAGQHALRQWRKHDRANALVIERIKQTVILDPAVDHRIARLMDQTGRAQLPENVGCFAGTLGIIAGNSGIERTAGADNVIERLHGLFKRRFGIETMRIEDVDIIKPHAFKALVAAGDEIFAAAPFTIGAGPHSIAGF